MKTQEVAKRDTLVQIAIQHTATPSWRTHGNGYAEMIVRYHTDAGWTSFGIAESYAGEAGRLTSKETHMTLDSVETARLREAIAPGYADLLAGAKGVVKESELFSGDEPAWVKLCRAAIAKAEGKEAK